jgi:penicillin-binding protein 2
VRGSIDTNPIPALRVWLTYAAIAGLLAVFIFRLYQLQISQGQDFVTAATDNRLETVNIPAPRGVIYDRNGSLLVRNIPSFNIDVTPALLPDSQAEIQAIYKKLSTLTGVPVSQEGEKAAKCVAGRGIQQLVDEGASIAPYDAWPIACNVDQNIARIVEEDSADMPGVSVETLPVRDYTTGSLTSSIIGYLGPIYEAVKDKFVSLGFDTNRDKIGYSGLELSYQDILAGRNGVKEVEVDVAGQVIREVGTVTQPLPGNSLRLTIDTRLQAAAESALQSRIDFMNRYSGQERVPLGVIIVMNPQTGEILAMASLPTYENNRMARFIPVDYYEQLAANTRGNPLVDHAIASEFPPGSTFKLTTSVGVLNEHVVTPNQTLFDPGKITIQNQYFPNDPGKAKDFVCWKADGHGNVNFVHGLAWSCNVYFYKVGGGYQNEVPNGGLGIERLGWYARELGYGGQLGIDLPNEENGLIPDPEYKRIHLGESWSTGDTYNSVVGQGFVSATPLQVLTSASTIANGGKVMWPHIVSDILNGEGNVVQHFDPCVLWNLTDGVSTPLDEIGANCPNVPDSVRTSREQWGSPDAHNVDPSVIKLVQEGMHDVVTLPPGSNNQPGTAYNYAQLDNISSAGKTGTGEFCDSVADAQGLCQPGAWPTHGWYVAYAPYDNPEIVAIGFLYNGGEGAVSAAPMVAQVMNAYFRLKAIDVASTLPQ